MTIPDSTNKERARDIYLVYQGWCLQNKCEVLSLDEVWQNMQFPTGTRLLLLVESV
ncbi:MAG: hypothetical protein QM487_13870 [Candidatus Marithrix sp.]